jgi:hypothetical protein
MWYLQNSCFALKGILLKMEERVRWKIVEYLRFLELQPMIAAIQALTTSVT